MKEVAFTGVTETEGKDGGSWDGAEPSSESGPSSESLSWAEISSGRGKSPALSDRTRTFTAV